MENDKLEAIPDIVLLTSWSENQDPWLGSLEKFPTVFHARASVLFEINEVSLQKQLVFALVSMQKNSRLVEITVADRDGYVQSNVKITVGIGNREGFDRFDRREEDRLLKRIEQLGAFNPLDLMFDLHYSIEDGKAHKVHQDQYLVRLAFQPGRFEVLLHHRKGVRRIDSDEMIQLLLAEINKELVRNKYSELELETLVTS